VACQPLLRAMSALEGQGYSQRNLGFMRFLRRKNCRGVSQLGALLSAFFALSWAGQVHAQNIRAEIAILSNAPARVRIQLALPHPTSVFSFRNSYAGVLGLGERIEHLDAELDGTTVSAKKLAPGEYETDRKVTRIIYEVNLNGPLPPAQMSHVSWLNNNGGLLMLSDLLPRAARESGGDASILVAVPSHWSVDSNVSRTENAYQTVNPDKAVFLVGSSVRRKIGRAGATNFSVVTLGKWPFADDDVLKIGRKLIEEYTKVTGHPLKSDPVLMLLPLPGEIGPERWTAETRGNAVVILIGSQAKRKQVLAKLGIVLTHEIFHLWVPNELTLAGDYDWFFEGFTLYQALRMALRLKLISFGTYLDTIARVYDSYLTSPEVDRLSLIEASERRWTSSSALVYDKGMLAAFVYDLALRSATDCERSLNEVYRQLFRPGGTGQGSANETIIGILTGPAAMNSFGREYVETAGRINLQPILSSYGLQLRPGALGQVTKLVLANNLNNVQRKALRCLGHGG